MSEGIDKLSAGHQEDVEFIKAFQAGDKAVFDKLIVKYKNKVFSLCYRLLGNYTEADDCAQEAFVKVYRSLKGFRFGSKFSTWLYRITVNTCKNKLTSSQYKRGKTMVRIDESKETENGVYSNEIAGSTPSPAVELERKEKGAAIQQAIDSLPAEQREVVVLRDVEGMSYEEVAEATGYNLGTVKSKLSRARLALKEKLKGLL